MSLPFGYNPPRYMGVPPPPPLPPQQQGSNGFSRLPRMSRMSPSLSPDFSRSHIPMSQSNNAIYTVMHSRNPRHSYDEFNEPRESILRSPSYDPLPPTSFSRSSSRSRSRSRRRSPSPSPSRSRSRSRSLRRVSFAEEEDGMVDRSRRNSAPSRSSSSLRSFDSFKLYDDRSPSPAPRNRLPSKPFIVSRDVRARKAAEDVFDDRRQYRESGRNRSRSRTRRSSATRYSEDDHHDSRRRTSGRDGRSRRVGRRSRHGRTH